MNLTLLAQDARSTTVGWQPVPGAACYALEWSDRMSDTVRFRTAGQTRDCRFRFVRSTHIPYYLRLRALDEAGSTLELSPVLTTPLARVLYPQLEALDRGLVAVATSAGVFLSWRLLRSEVDGYSATGLTGADFVVYKNGVRLADVTDSTNYLDPDGTERLLPAGVSLYDGYAFRSLQPEAVTVGYDLTLSEAPTSAREAAAQLARRLAERRGAEIAVRCDSAGILRSADDAPLLAIAGRTVLTVPGPASVERRLAMLAVRAAGLELREEAFGRADLPSLDELFFADHRGVTSLSRCDGQPLMTFVAERIAEAMEGLFPKK